MTEECKKLESSKKDQESLSKRVNMKVDTKSDKEEKEFKTLLEKHQILEVDKITLTQNIEELDTKKKDALEKCWLEVNAELWTHLFHIITRCFCKN